MQNFVGKIVVSLGIALAAVPAQSATVFNAAPADGWVFGSGNNYSPSNSAVLTTAASQQVYLRVHQTGAKAPASDTNGVYSFALGTSPISFDWGIDTNRSINLFNYRGVTALVTLTNVGTGDTASYNPFNLGFNAWSGWTNAFSGGSVQNSAQLGWFSGLNFNANADSLYKIDLTVNGLAGGTNNLSVYAKLGAGLPTQAPVPEPATWAMMIGGFALAGASMRARKTTLRFA